MALQPDQSTSTRTRPKSYTVDNPPFSIGGGPLSSHNQPPFTNFMSSNDSYISFGSPSPSHTPSQRRQPRHRRIESHGPLVKTSSLPHLEDSPYTSPRIQPAAIQHIYQPTVTTVYYGKKDILKITPLSSRRGTVLLSAPLKRKHLTDARDRGLATLRSKNQELQDKLEALQAANRALEADKQRLLNKQQDIKDELKTSKNYKTSLHRILSKKTSKENIYWFKGEPVFVVDETEAKGDDITAMNINLEVKQYKMKQLSKHIKIDKDMDNAALFESYLERIVRSSRIFQHQYYNTVKQQKQQNALTETEALKIKVKLENAEKDFNNKKKEIREKHSVELKKHKDKINEYKFKLQSITKEKQDLIATLGKSQTETEELIKEKETLEIDYGQVTNRLNAIQKHPILSNVNRVDQMLDLVKMEREFYDEIFDEKANVHNMAFEYVRKQIKSKTAFNGKYCKQMALKVLFEIIHMIWKKMKERFVVIYESIRKHLGVTTCDEKYDDLETDLDKTLDFVLKYQSEEIWSNLSTTMVYDIMEEIYQHQFDLIEMHDAQDIITYDLHETLDPFIRNKHLNVYMDKICMICWKMVIYCHKSNKDYELVFYPTSFIENNKDLKFNNNIYDKCTAHCEKKCDKILFYVFPIIIHSKDKKNISSASKIPIKVVTRDKLSKSLSKDIKAQSGGEPIDAVGIIKLLVEPPSIAVIGEAFASIHKQFHKNLFEEIEEYVDDDDSVDIEDEDMLEMKIYKILFHILVSCYIEIVNRVHDIKSDNLNLTTLKFDKRYHLLLNLEHYFNKFSKLKDVEDRDKLKDIQIVMGLVDGIYAKYCALYRFLEDQHLKVRTQIYIMKCCESCFHFVSYSMNGNEEYGLYPLCFVKDGTRCSVVEMLEEKSMNNEVIDFNNVLMGNDGGLCIYDDRMHEKESTSGDVEDIRNAKICYFTWPAIVTTNKNNDYIYGNVPKKYRTKIWVQIGDEIYDQIYAETQ